MEKTRISYEETPAGLYEVMINTEKYLKKCGIRGNLLKLIKVRASQINGCGYCLDMHHKLAIKSGESPERLYLLSAWEESPCYTAEEKAALNLTDMLTRISEAGPDQIGKAYERISRYYSNEQIANIVLAICQINSWNRIVITAGTIPGSFEA